MAMGPINMELPRSKDPHLHRPPHETQHYLDPAPVERQRRLGYRSAIQCQKGDKFAHSPQQVHRRSGKPQGYPE